MVCFRQSRALNEIAVSLHLLFDLLAITTEPLEFGTNKFIRIVYKHMQL
jgi:hypothetical protein